MTIVVLGAGSIGVYVGASLLAAGAGVLLLGRASMGERLAHAGVLLTDLHGRRQQVPGAQIRFATEPEALAAASLVLVTVKSADTAAAAADIARHAQPSCVVLSLQNGIGNADLLAAALPGRTVLGGMVPFNVVQMPGNRFHRGTEGELMTAQSEALAPWLAPFEAAGLPLQQRADFLEVQWGKLLLNLNNAVNALSNLPLKTELSQRAYRRCLALLIDEALQVLAAAGIAPAKLARVSPKMLPAVLRLPDWLFVRLAATMLRIDPEARSSMWEDLQAGRRTEIDYLSGAVVALAGTLGMAAPANARMIALVRRAEQGGGAAPGGQALLAALTAA
ncbi:MAG: 2-dehydropantoate 2-reductase [Massilia sp.]